MIELFYNFERKSTSVSNAPPSRDVWNTCGTNETAYFKKKLLTLLLFLCNQSYYYGMKQKTQLFITKKLPQEGFYLALSKTGSGDNIWTVGRHYTKFRRVCQSCVLDVVTQFDVKALRGFRGNRCVSIVPCPKFWQMHPTGVFHQSRLGRQRFVD